MLMELVNKLFKYIIFINHNRTHQLEGSGLDGSF